MYSPDMIFEEVQSGAMVKHGVRVIGAGSHGCFECLGGALKVCGASSASFCLAVPRQFQARFFSCAPIQVSKLASIQEPGTTC